MDADSGGKVNLSDLFQFVSATHSPRWPLLRFYSFAVIVIVIVIIIVIVIVSKIICMNFVISLLSFYVGSSFQSNVATSQLVNMGNCKQC